MPGLLIRGWLPRYSDLILAEMLKYDTLVKSRKPENLVDDLRETFQVLRSVSMKPNPVKYTFGVSSRKFLGYMVSKRGIEANI